jgi:hypothetical protein
VNTINVTAATLREHRVAKTTAHRWINRAVADGSWPVARVATATKPARALVMPPEAFDALVATLRGAT